MTPRTSSSTGHGILPSNFLQARSSGSSLQHHVVLHSNINESSSLAASTTGANRFELNLLDKDEKINTYNNSSRRPTNSLMTVHEQETTNELTSDDSLHVQMSADIPDQHHQRTDNDTSAVS